MHRALRALSSATLWAVCAFLSRGAIAQTYTEVDSFAVPTNATMMVYSPTMETLVIKNTASAVVAIDIQSRQATTRFANSWLSDISLSPSGRYVFATDYGTDNIVSAAPLGTSYVYRLDLTDMTWDTRTGYLAGKVEAVSDTQLILKSLDQWSLFTNNDWGSGSALIPLNTPDQYVPGPGFFAFVYGGDFRYDVRTGRLLHGNSGSSSQEVQAFKIVGNEFVKQEGSGSYGSAQGYGGSVVLATDGSAFYYGALQVDPLDVTHNLRVFPEAIHAANGSIALGNGKYYDTRTGALLGSLPFSTTVYAMNPSGSDFWAYNPDTDSVHRFVAPPAGTNVALATAGAVATASSSFGPGFPVASVNDGLRAGRNWKNGGGWRDATANVYPDWVQINFGGTRTIDRVVVYTIQDDDGNPIEPTDSLTFTGGGIQDFSVQGWKGFNWVTLASVSGNNLVKRSVVFAPFTTDRIRVNVTKALNSYSRIIEIEAWRATAPASLPSTTSLMSSVNPATTGASVKLTASVIGSTPTGDVAFTENNIALSGCGAVPLAGVGNTRTAVCTIDSLTAGTHSVVASYRGDSGNGPSTSSNLSQVVAQSPLSYTDVDTFAVPTNATMMVYSPAMEALVLKNTAASIVALDIESGEATTRLANSSFTDMSLSPSGRYVFASDYGGEHIGYGTPLGAHYVHRLDLSNMAWDIRTAYIAGNVQAVSDTQLILKSRDQWVTFTNNDWGSGNALVPLNQPSNPFFFGPGYYASVYAGDFRYDVRTGRLLHGGDEVQAFKILDNEFMKQEEFGAFSSQGFGGSVVLAADGSAFYYGALQVDPLDVTHPRKLFPEVIHAANGRVAFGDGRYYDANTGALLGSLPFSTTVYAMNPFEEDFWAFDPASTTVHHFVPGSSLPPTTTSLTSSASPATVGTSVRFTASVTGSSPTGSIAFTENGVSLNGCSAVPLAGGGNTRTTVCNTSTFAVGSHNIVASYSGDAANMASSSNVLMQVIAPVTSSNVALASAGAVATASSTFGPGYPVTAVNDGRRSSLNWGNGGGWRDGTSGAYPDWVQINFSGTKTIDRIVVYTLQDNYVRPIEPTDTQTFSLYGIKDFTVQGWTGSKWVDVTTVTGNNLVKRTVTFAAYATDRIRVRVTNASGPYSPIIEIEAWGQ